MTIGELELVRRDQRGVEHGRARLRLALDAARPDAGVPRQARRASVDNELLAQAGRAGLSPGEERQPVEELAHLVPEPRPGGDLLGGRELAHPGAEGPGEGGRARAHGSRAPRRPRGQRCQSQPHDRPRGRAPVRCGGRQCRRRLELLDDLRRGGDVEPERPNEAQKEPLVARVVVVVTQRAFQQYRVLGERLRDVEVAEALGHQVREMEGVELGAAKLVRQDRVDRPVDDRRLDLGAGVDPDHGGGVKDRVEVVVARLHVERLLPAPRPDADATARRASTPLHCRGVARVRPDQEPGVGEHAARARTAAIHRRTNGTSFGATNWRRADVEHDRLRRVEADLRRRTPRASCPASGRTSGRTRARRSAGCARRAGAGARRPPASGARSRRAPGPGRRGRGPCWSGCPS